MSAILAVERLQRGGERPRPSLIVGRVGRVGGGEFVGQRVRRRPSWSAGSYHRCGLSPAFLRRRASADDDLGAAGRLVRRRAASPSRGRSRRRWRSRSWRRRARARSTGSASNRCGSWSGIGQDAGHVDVRRRRSGGRRRHRNFPPRRRRRAARRRRSRTAPTSASANAKLFMTKTSGRAHVML